MNESLLLSWLAPSGIAAIVAFIVWLIQHNVAIVALKKAEGRREAEINKLFDMARENTAIITKTAILLDHVERRLVNSESDLKEHSHESENWKQRIVALEERLNHQGD